MQLNSTDETYENLSYEELQLPGDLYVYLNMCPDYIVNTMMRIELQQIFSRGFRESKSNTTPYF